MAFESKNNKPAFPPLPRWPAEVYPDEAAHGYFQRLALENGQASVRTLATNLGLNARNIVPETFLELALRFPVRNKEELLISTPKRVGRFVVLRGQQFRYPRDWSTKRVRVCPGCLHEKRYHRFWFDLNVLSICPIHSCDLVEAVNGEKLNWWFPQVGIVPVSGKAVGAYHSRAGSSESFERYILGRLGVLPPWSIPILDSSDLYQIIDVAELLGVAKQEGWASKRPARSSRLTSEFRQLVSDGFSILIGGKDTVQHFLGMYSNGRNIKTPSKGITYLYARYWGWLHDALRLTDKNSLAKSITTEMSLIAAENGVYSKRADDRSAIKQSHIKFSEVAKICGVSPDLLRAVTDKIGATEEFCPRGQTLHLPNSLISEIKYILSDLITTPEALKFLKISRYVFPKYCEKNGISIFIKSKGNISTRYRRSELAEALNEHPPLPKYSRKTD